MRAIVMTETGGPEVLQLRDDVELGEPGRGQLKVKVDAAGVNFIDTYQRSGLYPVKLPYTPGLEGAGRVLAVGEGVTDVLVGERVAWAMAPGSYAEEILLDAEKAVPIPGVLSPSVAAAAMLQGMTAHFLCHDTWQVKHGDTVLIHAGAGGVGLLLIQMCFRLGARVFTTVSTEEKAVLARRAGATEAILYTETDFAEEIRRLTEGRGVDVVYDSVGKTTFEKSLDCLRRRGMLVVFGGASGPVPPFDIQELNRKGSLFLTRPTLADHIADRASLLRRAGDVLMQVSRGDLDVRVGATYPLGDVAEAHRALEGRATTGKVLLAPNR
ncbi:MAG TPA: quinone oxidoreductase [Myxococcaceae bacterium]|nr:quinone oxidoreductase [Myxococcaceae bacterium]